MTRAWITAAIVGVVAIVMTLAHAPAFGTSNELTYLLDPLHRAHPELLAHDWLVTETTAYHPVFAAFAAQLFRIDDAGVIAFAIAHLVAMAITFALLYRLVAEVAQRDRLAIFLVLAGLLVLGAGRALAGTYLFAEYLQPSSLATIGWLAAMIMWLRDRPLATGVCLAAAGACHINFLVLGILLFGTLELRRPARLAAVLGPSILVLAAFLPSIARGMHASDPALALRVLVAFHAPGHYDPHRLALWLPPLAGWLVAAWAVLPADRPPTIDRLWRFALAGTTLCLAAALIIWIPLVLPLTRLFVWRIAPFAQLASQLLVLACAFRRDRALALVLGLGLVIGWSLAIPSERGTFTCALATVVIAIAIARRRRRGCLMAGLVACMLALAGHARALLDPPIFHEETGGAYGELVTWARTTDRDAVFLVPPYLNRFRLLARRAIVADTKSPPLHADELVAWYRRLCAIANVPDAATHEQIEALWDRESPEQLAAVAHTYGAGFVVIDKARSPARLAAPIAFENYRLVAYRVQ